jgi:hypothetical protein
VYFQLILIFLGGVLGTGHHLYWAGGPSMWVPLGSMFSFIEVLPLVLLIIEAIQQHQLIRRQQVFNYRLAYTYIIGAAFWNFVGAGVFGGGTLNAPLINYYEHGTFLTLNHAHTALFGAFGARDRPYLFLPALRDGRPRALRRADRAVGVLALQCRACALDPAQLLPDRLAATRGCVPARSHLRPQRDVLRHHFVLAVDAASGRCRVRDRGVADGLGFYDQGAPAAASVGRALDSGRTSG